MRFLIKNGESLLAVWNAATVEEASERLERLKEQNSLPCAVKIQPVHLPVVRNIKDLNKRDPAYLYIGRGSKWGNPYIMRTGADRNKVIEQYKKMIINNRELLDKLYELNGKKLACYCYPLKCHGDILADLFKKRFGL